MFVNFLLFQIGWFACVAGAGWGLAWLGPAFLPLVTGVYFATATHRRGAAVLVVGVALVGGLADGVAAHLGYLSFPDTPWAVGPLPLWMLSLWAMFATTLDRSMGWIRRFPVLAAALGAVAGPLAYAGGERLGALQLGDQAYLWLAIEWGVLMPASAWCAGRLGSLHTPNSISARNGVTPVK